MQGGKQNANETKGDGKSNPCKRMDVQKSRRLSQKLHPTKPGKVTIPFHKGKDLTKKLKILSKNRRGLNSSTACSPLKY